MSPPDTPLRILIGSRAPFFAGAEQSCARLAAGLARHKHQVVVVLGKRGEAYDHMTTAGIDCRVIPLPTTSKWGWWSYHNARRRLCDLIESFQPDVVHANDLPSLQMLADAASRFGLPRICHHRFAYTGQAIRWYLKFGAEQHIFVSQNLMQQMHQRSPELAAAPGAAIHNAMPTPPLPDEDDRFAARRALGLPENRRLVVFTGQVIERKGVADLLHAWSQLDADLRRSAALAVVGDDLRDEGQYRQRMQQLADQLNIDVHFPGFRRDIPRWMAAAELVVLPSHEEPLGLTVMEAMAHGRVAIGSCVGGIPEMIQHGQTGLLVEPGNPAQLASAITQALNEPAAAQWAAQARRNFEEHFSIDGQVRNVVELYRRHIAPESVRRVA